MRVLCTVLSAFLVTSCSLIEEGEAVQYRDVSNFKFDEVGRCVSQDMKSVFPRLFLSSQSDKLKLYRGYNGLAIKVAKEESIVKLEVIWDKPLSKSQKSYLDFCLKHAYSALY